MSTSFTSELLKEMENALGESNKKEEEDFIDIKYSIIPGHRDGSELMWAYEEKQLYYKNSFSKKKNLTGFTCRIKGCQARVYVRSDKTAYRDLGSQHLAAHGSQYQEYKYMYCDDKMKQKAKTAPASMTAYNIYMEVVVE